MTANTKPKPKASASPLKRAGVEMFTLAFDRLTEKPAKRAMMQRAAPTPPLFPAHLLSAYHGHDGGQNIDWTNDTHENPKPTIADGVVINQPDSVLERWHIKQVRGSCAALTSSADAPPWGFSNQCCYLNNIICVGYIGIDVRKPDSLIQGNRVCFQRDYGEYLRANEWASNCQSIANHFYGCWAASYNNAAKYKGIGNKYADSKFGYIGGLTSWNSKLLGCEFYHNFGTSVQISATTQMYANTVDVPMAGRIHKDTAGIELSAPDSTFLAGDLILNWFANENDSQHKTCVAGVILKAGADRSTFQTNIDGRQGIDNERGFIVEKPIKGGEFDITVSDVPGGFRDPNDICVEIKPEAGAGTVGTDWYIKAPKHEIKNLVKLPPSFNKKNLVMVKDTATGDVTRVWPPVAA